MKKYEGIYERNMKEKNMKKYKGNRKEYMENIPEMALSTEREGWSPAKISRKYEEI